MPQGDMQIPSHTIEVDFPVQGNAIPLDHGYALYAALSRLPGVGRWLHGTDKVAIHSIRGDYAGKGLLKLSAKSRLRLRLPHRCLSRILPLAGKRVIVDDHFFHPVRIGVPQTTLLRPAAALYAHMVTTRNGQDEHRFDTEIRRQLATLDIAGKPTRGKRRVLRIKGKAVVGHSLLVSELTAEESIRLQEVGLGGRRKMGCGVFIPWRG